MFTSSLKSLDGGPVILQAKVPIFADDTVDNIFSRVQEQEHRIYPLVAHWFINERLAMIDGQASLDGNTLASHGYAADD